MKNWREIFNLSEHDSCKKGTVKFKGFKDHLNAFPEKQNCIFHRLVHVYLEKMYGYDWDKGIGQKEKLQRKEKEISWAWVKLHFNFKQLLL